jgi:hypothetical protein
MTKEQYLHILLVSGRDWFNWHELLYSANEFVLWGEQGLLEQNTEPNGKMRYSYWKLTDLAREVHGVKND